jgi:hypothetical protein
VLHKTDSPSPPTGPSSVADLCTAMRCCRGLQLVCLQQTEQGAHVCDTQHRACCCCAGSEKGVTYHGRCNCAAPAADRAAPIERLARCLCMPELCSMLGVWFGDVADDPTLLLLLSQAVQNERSERAKQTFEVECAFMMSLALLAVPSGFICCWGSSQLNAGLYGSDSSFLSSHSPHILSTQSSTP